jgi:tetratricopeptide (TPR) repeat protein
LKDSAALNRIFGTAMQHATAGRYDQALRALKSEGEIALRHPIGRNILGGIFREQGKLDDALRAFDRAAKAAPNFPEAHCNRGAVLQELGRLDEALAALDKALLQRRNYPLALFNRGNVLNGLGRLDEATAAYSEAIELKGDFVDAYLNRGLVQARMGNFTAALEDANRALVLRSGHDEATILKARALVELGRAEDSLMAVDGLLRRIPENMMAHVVRSTALWKLGRYDEALAVADKAVLFDANNAESHAVRGFILGDLLRREEQVAALGRAVRLDPANPRHHHSRAVALSEAGRATEALAAYDEAVRLAPDDAAIRYHRSLIRLYLGDFEGGLAEHEWRLRKTDFVGTKFLKVAPLWTGEDLTDKKVLVYAEQGMGDTIQFMRYLPLFVERGAEVRLLAPAPLTTLVQVSFPEIEIVLDLAGGRDFDFQVPLLSLAHVFKTRLETIPANVPYLRVDAERVATWRERVGGRGFRIGVAWQGNPVHPSDRFRSTDPASFAPIAALADVRLISLQAIHGLDKLGTLPPEVVIENFGDEIARNPEGFSEVAALMENLDLVVTVDSAIAHLAGALGRPVWVSLRAQPEWRWTENRSDSPWYPTMRLFRQSDPLVWDDVYAAVARDVATLLQARSGKAD